MVEGVKKVAISNGLVSREKWTKGIVDLYKASLEDGTFCYTFCKAIGEA